jgi:hypothetical protein
MGFATWGQDQIPDEKAAETITLTMTRGAAKGFTDALLDAAGGGKADRDWLLWGVGRIATAYGAEENGPDDV